MDFVYETDSFSQENGDTSFQSPSFKMPQAFQSFQTSELSKRFGKLSILNMKKKGDETSASGQGTAHEVSVERARETVELIDTLEAESTSRSTGQVNETGIMNKLSLITERSSSYDSSLRNSLAQLELRVELETDKLEGLDDDVAKNARSYLKNLTEKGPIGAMSRNYMRGLIEEDLIKEQAASLRGFQKVVSSINSVRDDITEILDESDELTAVVKEAISSTKTIQAQIEEYSHERAMVNVKKDLLLAFKSTFTLNQYEDHILKFGDLNDHTTAVDFFNAIERVKEIQSNCDILLGLENETLGLNILSNMSDVLHSVKDKVLYYVQKNIETIYSSSDLSMAGVDSETFQKAFVYIWVNDNEGFDSVVSKLVATRSKIVLNDFMNQLKNYSNEGRRGSLEDIQNSGRLFLSSYDTNKFVSDTLAYVHNILVNEIEGTKSLLTFQFTKEIPLSEKELNGLIGRVVQNIISCLCRPVRGSIENSIRQEGKISVLNNVCGVLDLYKSMYSKLLPDIQVKDEEGENQKTPDSLIATISALEVEMQERVFSLINLKLKNIEADLGEENSDGSLLPDWIVDWCQFIDELFQNDNAAGTDFIMGFSEEQWDQFLSLIIDSPLRITSDRVKKAKGEAKEDMLIWEINILDYIISRVSVIRQMNSKCQELETTLKSKINALKTNEFNKLLNASGLFDIYNLINMIFELDEELFDVMYYQSIVENKMFNVDTFREANTKLSEFLSTYINNNALTKLMSPAIYNEIFTGSSVKFVKFYGKVLAITNEYLKDSNGDSCKILQWDESSVATLLGIEEEP